MRPALLALFVTLTACAAPPQFTPSACFHERTLDLTLPSGVRLHLNLPAKIDDTKPTALILYATPNGNTIEQTLGCAKAENLDWHYDIQHVAAQVRRLRELNPRENLALAVTEAPKLSWPAFRQSNPDHQAIIRSIVDTAVELTGAKSITLTGHSGGGSFIFGYLNAHDAIPAQVTRIAFLDANYAYTDDAPQNHGDKLIAWLKAEASRHLVVIAYDDREITLNGKKVVSPTGGTYRATSRMLDRFRKDAQVSEVWEAPFVHHYALGHRFDVFVHPNPQNQILHTALVGEMNGLLQALTLGMPEESKWGTFGGPRAYDTCIQPAPPTLKLPPRAKDAPTGSQFAKLIESLSPQQREAEILKQITAGNVPPFLRTLKPIYAEFTDGAGQEHTIFYWVTPDHLALGTDDDFFRVPMTPQTAQKIADACDASLITRKISDDIFRSASARLAPIPLIENRESAATFFRHHQLIEEGRTKLGARLGALVAGDKKDVVLSNRLAEKPRRVAIYGWHKTTGEAIQPLTIVHADTYVDYSHGVRLLGRHVTVDGRPADARDVTKNATLAALLSDEGPLTGAEYPDTAP
jgi:hypothetical protein